MSASRAHGGVLRYLRETQFINRHLTGQFDSKYTATIGVDVNPLRFHTSKGDIVFKCWDCAGQEKLRGAQEGNAIKL